MNQQFRWTDSLIESAVELWKEGLSLTQIGKRFGTTRSATAGMVYRNRSLFYARPTGRTKEKSVKTPKQTQTTWTPERLELAAKWWSQGVPAVDIAARLDVKLPSFQSAVQRYREKFPVRAKAAIKKEKPPLKTREVAENVIEFERSEGFDLRRFQIAGAEPVAFVDLDRRQCRFPLEDFQTVSGPNSPCCGKTVADGKSYCPTHMHLMYRPYVQKHG